MTTMVTFQIIPEALKDHPLLRKLQEDGFGYDFQAGSNHAQVPCEPQAVIPSQLSGHPVLTLLASHGLFAFGTPENTVYLPISHNAARILRISPCAAVPLDSFLKGMRGALDRFHKSADFSAATNGDAAALTRLCGELKLLQSKSALALKNGDLYVADPRRT